ncbi:NAD(P) transhydrogenase subunit alpha [Pseudomonas sp. MWU12-2345]|uniref:NAD(P) transhydrogenase subunit alpha n=1 Tax=Pseudomonas sp. MWU12-2345 TaxID=2928689 RepID=UPI00200DD32C|nr:NAD(P) transhydrogenase subunit alpha [Pseudomonas sp. MWU12-2345]
MYVNLAVLKETHPHERRVALVPGLCAKLRALGARLHMLAGAGEASFLPDSAYPDVVFLSSAGQLVHEADVVLAVQAPSLELIGKLKPGAVLLCFIYAQKNPALVQRLLERQITCFAMERLPRITRAQSMDALSSQSALSGYYAVQLGSVHMSRILPKVTTAAGIVGPAHVLVLGLGVAGLEAIATAHRLGAVVEGYDVRPETAEQARSLGAGFVDVGIDARGKGGYARELSEAEKAQVAQVLTEHIQQADLVITTAAVPGRPSPRLVSAAQLAGMKPGAVIVDLGAEGGGNCEGCVPGQTVMVGGVTLMAPLNLPSSLSQDASQLYAKNQFNLLALMLKNNVIDIDWDDEILAQTVLTHAGQLMDPASHADAEPDHAARETRS